MTGRERVRKWTKSQRDAEVITTCKAEENLRNIDTGQDAGVEEEDVKVDEEEKWKVVVGCCCIIIKMISVALLL